jgi:hypothetical protein
MKAEDILKEECDKLSFKRFGVAYEDLLIIANQLSILKEASLLAMSKVAEQNKAEAWSNGAITMLQYLGGQEHHYPAAGPKNPYIKIIKL